MNLYELNELIKSLENDKKPDQKVIRFYKDMRNNLIDALNNQITEKVEKLLKGDE